MRLLLPPSEGKSRGGRGRPLRVRGLTSPVDEALAAARGQVIDALLTLAEQSTSRARDALLLPAGVLDEALDDARAVLDSPTTPALQRYTGVVYDGLGVAAMSTAQRRLAGRVVLMFSGLFGVVRGDEPIPRYRVPAKAVLPGLGIASTFWRPVLQQLPDSAFGRGPILDLRSGDYARMWRPSGPLAERVLTVRILSPAPGGRLAVVSFASKLAKGRLAAELIRQMAGGTRVSGADDVVAAWLRCGGVDAVVRAGGHLDLHTASATA